MAKISSGTGNGTGFAVALLVATIGGMMVYSALKGVGITDVFAGDGGGDPLDPHGSSGGVSSASGPGGTSGTSLGTAGVLQPDLNPGGGLQLPESFIPTHATAGLAGYPAIDVFGKPGRVVLSPVDGRVTRWSGEDPARGAYQGAGGPFGWSMYIQGDNGKTYYLTHMGTRSVSPGQRVKRGQPIGTIGDYPGATPDHIHEGVHG